jgi:5-methylcytosine-specific restriction endonuclease McrA
MARFPTKADSLRNLDEPWCSRLWKQRVTSANIRAESRSAPGKITVADVIGVLDRCNWRCCLCGSDQDIQIDHRIPLAGGGENTVANIRILCEACNCREGAIFARYIEAQKGQ